MEKGYYSWVNKDYANLKALTNLVFQKKIMHAAYYINKVNDFRCRHPMMHLYKTNFKLRFLIKKKFCELI